MKKLFFILMFLPLLAISQHEKADKLTIWETSRLVGDVTIGSKTFDSSALLTLTSTDKGILIPRMTTTQRDAISTPSTSLLLYNSTTNQFEYYDGTWKAIGITVGDMLKTVYDTNNDSVVNNSDSLNSQSPVYYQDSIFVSFEDLKSLTGWYGMNDTLKIDTSGGVGDSSFVTLQVDTVKAFNNSTIQFTNSVVVNDPFTVNLAQTTLKGIDATSGNFVAKFQDNVSIDLFNVRNDVRIGVGMLPVGVGLGTNSYTLSVKASVGGGGIKPVLGLFDETGTIRVRFTASSGVGGADGGALALDNGSANNTIILYSNSPSKIEKGLRIGDGTVSSALLVESTSDVASISIKRSGVARLNLGGFDPNGGILQIFDNSSVKEIQLLGIASGGQFNYINSGNVGINETAPSAKLHVKGIDATSSNFALKVQDNVGTELFSIRNDGKIGIGTVNPSEKLHINGNILCDTLFSEAINIYSVSDTIDSAAISVLNGTPVEIVASPGSGKAIEVISWSIQAINRAGFTAWATNTNIALITNTANLAQATDTKVLLSTATRITRGTIIPMDGVTTKTQVIENKALMLTVLTGNPNTGNFKIKNYVTYRIITL